MSHNSEFSVKYSPLLATNTVTEYIVEPFKEIFLKLKKKKSL
jgi:hypothetical protein